MDTGTVGRQTAALTSVLLVAAGVAFLGFLAQGAVAAAPSPAPGASVTSLSGAEPDPEGAPAAQVGLGWERVDDADLVSHPRNGNMHGVIAGGPGAIAWGFVLGMGPRIWTTMDGRDWVPASVEVPNDPEPEYPPGEVLDVTAGGPGFVAVGVYMRDDGNTAIVWTSTDGLTWLRVPHGPVFEGVYMGEVVAWRDGLLAFGCELVSATDCGPPASWASPDGVTWSRVALELPEGTQGPMRLVPSSDRLWGVAWDAGDEPLQGPQRWVTSTDGAAWTQSELPYIGSFGELHALPDGLYLTVTSVASSDARDALGVHRSTDSTTWTPLAVGRPLGREIVAVGETLVMVGSRGGCRALKAHCVAAGWRSMDGGLTWARAPVTGTPRWASRAWMTGVAGLTDGTLVAVGTELEGGHPSTAAWVSPAAFLPPTATLPPADALPLPESIRPPAGSRIAYVEGEEGTAAGIHVVSADGDDDRFMALGTLPSWSPDGERIAYTCKPDRIDSVGSVCIVDLRTGASKVVVKAGTRARWSPSGDLIAFSRDVFGLGDAWLYRADPRATWPLPGALPEWSPTGRRLQVLTAEGQPEKPIIHVLRPDGSGERDLGEGWNATWSPDGRSIAATWWDGAHTSVTAIDPRTGVRELLFEIDAPILALRWLIDNGLAFVAERGVTSSGDLYLVEQSTGAVRSLTSGIDVTPDLTVSPDGQWLAFTATVDGRSDLYVASRKGGWMPVTSSGHATRPIWQPAPG